MTELVGAMMKTRNIIFSELANKVDQDALLSSIESRIQDFVQKVDYDYEQLLLCFVSGEKIVLSIDRTEWDCGTIRSTTYCLFGNGLRVYWT